MKNLIGIAFISLPLLFTCCEREKTGNSGYTLSDPVQTIVPDSALLRIDPVRLEALRDSNLVWFQQSEKQGRFEDAMNYNAQYRLYNDSVLKVQRNREIAEVLARYEHEKLLGEQEQLALEKSRMQQWGLLVLLVFLAVGGWLMIAYQRRVLRKERAIREEGDRLQQLRDQVRTNEDEIALNDKVIETINGQLARQTELAEVIEEQLADIERIREENERLLSRNERMKNEIKRYTYLSEEQEEENEAEITLQESGLQDDYKQILRDREVRLTGLLIRELDLLRALKAQPFAIIPEQEVQLMEETEVIYPEFARGLRKKCPKLSNRDVTTCCLIKLAFTISEIAVITDVDPSSVSRRKSRIREDMQAVIPDMRKDGMSLDVYLYKWKKEGKR